MTADQDRLTQSKHAQELQVVRILTKTFGISRSQARRLFRLQQAQDEVNRHGLPPRANVSNLYQDVPQIRRTETTIETPVHVRANQADSAIVPQQVLTSFELDPPFPTEEGRYNLSVDDEAVVTWTSDTLPTAPSGSDGVYVLKIISGVASWAVDTESTLPTDDGIYRLKIEDSISSWLVESIPEAPDAAPGQDLYYALRRNSSSDPAWDLSVSEVPNDSLAYWRKYGVWEEVNAVEEAPLDGLRYIRGDGLWYTLDDSLDISATVDSVSTVSPGSAATATASFIDSVFHFAFEIPKGDPGDTGPPGPSVDLTLLRDYVIDILVEFGLIPPP